MIVQYMHTVTAITVLMYKMTLLIIGYLIVKLGYQLLLKGIKGDFDFSGEGKPTTGLGFKASLKSSSPGLLFLVLGTFLLITSVFKEIKFETKAGNDSSVINSEAPTPPDLSDLLGGT